MTINIGANLAQGATSSTVVISDGEHLLAVSGTFGGAVVNLYANIGVASDTPITPIAYTGPNSDIIWLPNCTVYVVVVGGDGTTDINVAMAQVASKVDV